MRKIHSLLLFVILLHTNVKSQSGSPTCLNMPGICVNAMYMLDNDPTGTFTATSLNPGNDYSCVFSQPVPNWFFMRVTQSGSLDFTISAANDIDFVLYGPFSSYLDIESQCNNYGQPGFAPVVDCSYSTASVENVNIANALYGEYYVILITNFTNLQQTVTFTQTGGTGTIACNANTTVAGTVYGDLNSDCVLDSTDLKIPYAIVKNVTYGIWGNTNANGDYIFPSDTGTIEIQQIIPAQLQPLMTQTCPAAPLNQFAYVPTDSSHITDINFGNDVVFCPALEVELTSTPLRLCSSGHIEIEYCNIGFADTSNVELVVEIPTYITVTGASEPYTINSDGNLVFIIGNLAAGTCGTLTITDSVDCDINNLGLTQCIAAWMDPGNGCLFDLDTNTASWDHSSVSVEGDCVGDSLACFTITNNGSSVNGNMLGTSEYRIYENNVLVFTGTFQLAGGDSVTFCWPSNGNTIRLEADQRPFHPGNSHPNDNVENCGTDSLGNTILSQIIPAPIDDLDLIIDEDCMLIVAAYDPNYKSVSPAGIGNNYMIVPETPLEYEVHFQNTGSDTAYNIMVVDTLSQFLDITTLSVGNASHNFDLQITGQNRVVLKYYFNDIMLPDSTTDLIGSQGFFSYSIAPLPGLPLGTEIHNYAQIYFDFNPPIFTNDAWITYDLPSKPLTISNQELGSFNVYPNPTKGIFTLESEKNRMIQQYEIMDVTGKVILNSKVNGSKTEINLTAFEKGIYLVKIHTANGIEMKKVVKE